MEIDVGRGDFLVGERIDRDLRPFERADVPGAFDFARRQAGVGGILIADFLNHQCWPGKDRDFVCWRFGVPRLDPIFQVLLHATVLAGREPIGNQAAQLRPFLRRIERYAAIHRLLVER